VGDCRDKQLAKFDLTGCSSRKNSGEILVDCYVRGKRFPQMPQMTGEAQLRMGEVTHIRGDPGAVEEILRA